MIKAFTGIIAALAFAVMGTTLVSAPGPLDIMAIGGQPNMMVAQLEPPNPPHGVTKPRPPAPPPQGPPIPDARVPTEAPPPPDPPVLPDPRFPGTGLAPQGPW
jgi:hypothetical protein